MKSVSQSVIQCVSYIIQMNEEEPQRTRCESVSSLQNELYISTVVLTRRFVLFQQRLE